MQSAKRDAQISSQILSWVSEFVVELNLCPFAAAPLKRGQVNIVVAASDRVEPCLQQLVDEADRLAAGDSQATTLFVLPSGFEDFADYLDLLDLGNALFENVGLEGAIQIASFHPQYQFEGTAFDAQENWTNRAPFPILHLITETSVSDAVDKHPDAEGIPDANIRRLQSMDVKTLNQFIDAVVS